MNKEEIIETLVNDKYRATAAHCLTRLHGGDDIIRGALLYDYKLLVANVYYVGVLAGGGARI